MKRVVLLFIIAALVIATSLLWFLKSETSFNLMSLLNLSVIILVVGFAVFLGIKRFGSIKRGEPAEDELSKKIMLKTAALSYYISLYLWLLLLYFSDRIELEAHTQIAAGMVGMALSFAVSYAIVYLKASRNG